MSSYRYFTSSDPLVLFVPLCFQVILSCFVWFCMYFTRVQVMQMKKISPQELADRHRFPPAMKEAANQANNFSNLLEVPLFFYTLTLSLYVTRLHDSIDLQLLWCYVLLRAVHSFIHCTYNRVMHRFTVYFTSSCIIWFLWARFAVKLSDKIE